MTGGMEPTAHIVQVGAKNDLDLVFTHVCIDGKQATTRLPLCASWWHVLSRDPLTISPSIHCLVCGLHGFITNGAWMTA